MITASTKHEPVTVTGLTALAIVITVPKIFNLYVYQNGTIPIHFLLILFQKTAHA